MIDNEYALLVMGNHEFNAIAYATPDIKDGGFLRMRSEKNKKSTRLSSTQIWMTKNHIKKSSTGSGCGRKQHDPESCVAMLFCSLHLETCAPG
jgi:hypothetical protein